MFCKASLSAARLVPWCVTTFASSFLSLLYSSAQHPLPNIRFQTRRILVLLSCTSISSGASDLHHPTTSPRFHLTQHPPTSPPQPLTDFVRPAILPPVCRANPHNHHHFYLLPRSLLLRALLSRLDLNVLQRAHTHGF